MFRSTAFFHDCCLCDPMPSDMESDLAFVLPLEDFGQNKGPQGHYVEIRVYVQWI